MTKQSNPNNASGPSKPVTRNQPHKYSDPQLARKHDAILRRLDESQPAILGGRK